MFLRFLGVIIVLSLCVNISCSKKQKTDKIHIGFSQAMHTDNWRKEMEKAMEVQSSLYPNINLEIKDAANSIDQQKKQIDYFIKQDVDVLIVSPIQSTPITPAIENAIRLGIPTIIIDRKIDGNSYTAYIGANNIDIGRNAAKYILSDIKSKASIVEITGDTGSSPAEERQIGFNAVIKNSSKAKIVSIINGNWEKVSITEPLSKLLDTIEPPDYIFAHNDRMAVGTWEVLKQKGLENRIKIIGVDGLYGPNGGIQYVKDGIFMATILYPTGGAEAIKLALDIIKGTPIDKNNILNTVVIDSVNVDLMQNQFNKLVAQQNDIESQQEVITDQVKAYQSQNSLIKLMIGLLILLLVLSFWSIYSAIKISRSKRRLEINNEKIKTQRNQIKGFAKQLKISNESKINFFTALSHEFKTPLTLITTAVESISKNNMALLGKSGYEIDLINNNSNRLIRLINELLDFRKLETNSFILKPRIINLNELIIQIYNDFRVEAIKRSIDLKINLPDEPCNLFIDRNAIDKVLFNIVSNALKFTPNQGTIKITLHNNGLEEVKITIKDSGIGIPTEEVDKIFNPFVQATNNNRSGSGLGLYISKQLVELHKGTIELNVNHGTEFIIKLMKGKKHLEHLAGYNQQVNAMPFDPATTSNEMSTGLNLEAEEIIINENVPTVLIIEDNMDLQYLLFKQLKVDYNVYNSIGNDAIEKALDIIPDIIICDLNLPQTSGFDISTQLKNDLRTSHVPVIILTAMADDDSYLKALKSGADLYITKPFQLEALKESMRTILFNREKLRYYYSNKIDTITNTSFDLNEQNFIKQVNKLIEQNLNNPAFSVEELAQHFGVSRVQLYRKVKAIIGVSVSEYINQIRLEKAQEMLQDSSVNISEIAYSVGYSSPGYFSTAFKNKYGVSPKNYRG